VESHAVSNKLLIDFWGLTINAEGVYAIGAAVVIVFLLVLLRWSRPAR
jgi:hypothetical protein